MTLGSDLKIPEITAPGTGVEGENHIPAAGWIVTLFLFCVFVLFFKLGGAALFEPDEGRNAEVAREILLLRDWVTPHYDFIPRLDKPIAYYWLVALSYKFFGISEWSARLPSAISALGTLVLVYFFTLRFLGPWHALWTALILLTSVEFFALARIVIPDMVLTFFLTLGLLSFLRADCLGSEKKRRTAYLLAYGAFGAATLIKGIIGIVLPGIVIVLYLLVTRKWCSLRRMELRLGLVLFLTIVTPWYVWAEVRNPGYLRYFLLEEHLLRFSTSHFNRSQPWYFFISVLALGFFPWTLLLPAIAQKARKMVSRDEWDFLIAWAAMTFLFFSVSVSKLPHYILPMFPPLSILAGQFMVENQEEGGHSKWLSCSPVFCLLSLVAAAATVVIDPSLAPNTAADKIIHSAFPEIVYPLALVLGAGAILSGAWFWTRRWWSQKSLFLMTVSGFAFLLLFVEPVSVRVSLLRSSKDLAVKSAPLIDRDAHVAIYDAYAASLPYYLQISKPITIISSGTARRVMGSAYIAERRPAPVSGYGAILINHEEFSALWKSTTDPLFVFIPQMRLEHLEKANALSYVKLLQNKDIVLIKKREIP